MNNNTSDKTSNNSTKEKQLYSAFSINIATFLGGPLAAGYIISENYKALNKPKESRISLILGIVCTILLFIGIFLTPENIIEKIPKYLIPAIYIGIIGAIVQLKFGKILEIHKENGNSFFSGWRAAGIGFISLIITLLGILGGIYTFSNDEVYEKYETELAKFSQNEEETMVFYDHLQTESTHSLIKELKEITIPKWKENIEIIERVNLIKDLPSELKEQNKILLDYSKLRLEAFEMIKKSILENTNQYDTFIDELHEDIDKKIAELN